jgi:hypothetical protein
MVTPSRVRTKEMSAQIIEVSRHMEDPRQDPRFAVALLKVAVMLRKPDADRKGLDAILASVLQSLGFDPEAFARFVRLNRPLLEFTARAKGYAPARPAGKSVTTSATAAAHARAARTPRR